MDEDGESDGPEDEAEQQRVEEGDEAGAVAARRDGIGGGRHHLYDAARRAAVQGV